MRYVLGHILIIQRQIYDWLVTPSNDGTHSEAHPRYESKIPGDLACLTSEFLLN